MKIRALGQPASRAERVGVASAALLLVVWALWRTQYGADLGDGAHSVMLAIRLADGAVPFVDEMNAQATGSFLAVPFTWLWLHVVGLDGIVLASRVFFVALTTIAGYVAYRALRPAFRPWVAFAVPAIGLVPTSFNLMLVNYTTVPNMALVVATAAAHAAVVRGSARWASVAGAAAAMAGFSHPGAIVPAALLILLCLFLSKDRRVRLMLLAGAGVVSLAAVIWVVVVGLSNVRETIDYTSAYQANRLPPVERVKAMVQDFVDGLVSWRYVPMWILAALALIPRIDRRMKAALFLSVVIAAAIPSILITGTTELPPLPFGRFSGIYATVVTGALCIPVAVAGLHSRDRDVRTLLALSLPPALISLPIVTAFSSANPAWGGVALCLAPAFGAVSAMAVILVSRRSQAIPAIVVAGSLLAVMSVHTVFSFRDPAPWDQTARITDAAFAGIRSTPARAGTAESARALIEKWSGPKDSVYIHDNPGAYLFVRGRIDTNIIWVPTHLPSHQTTLDFFKRRDDFPDVVFMFSGRSQLDALGEERWRAADPMVDYVYAHYDEVTPAGSPYLAFHRRASN